MEIIQTKKAEQNAELVLDFKIKHYQGKRGGYKQEPQKKGMAVKQAGDGEKNCQRKK